MSRLNRPTSKPAVHTHEGGPAKHISPELQLRRSVLACLLWEDQFYESGEDIAARIVKLARQVAPKDSNPVKVSALAIEARSTFNLRHAPLLLTAALVKHNPVARLIPHVVQRADEMSEFLAIYAKLNNIPLNVVRKSLPKAVRRGLSRCFANFDAYQLAKYDREGAIRLRDVAFLSHPKSNSNEEGVLMAKLVNKSFFPEKTKSGFEVKSAYGLDGFEALESPDTWEVALSGGANKKETFTRLLKDKKLGYLALLRNLRNMTQAGVDIDLIREAVIARRGGAHRVLPFRYVAAARACPQLEPAIDQALCEAINHSQAFDGKTIVLVDVSGSMDSKLSGKSDMNRVDAAAALASIINADRRVFTFSNEIVEVPPRFGMAGVDAINQSQDHGGTYLGAAIEKINRIPHDRLIVITDEQAHDRVPDPVAKRAYVVNVASYQHGVGYGKYIHIDGFSEGILRYIQAIESDGPVPNGEMG